MMNQYMNKPVSLTEIALTGAYQAEASKLEQTVEQPVQPMQEQKDSSGCGVGIWWALIGYLLWTYVWDDDDERRRRL